MTAEHSHRFRTRGAVLIVVLWVLVILTALCLTLNTWARGQTWQTARLAVDTRAEQALQSGLAIAEVAIAADGEQVDCLSDAWAVGGEGAFSRRLNGTTLVLFSVEGEGVRPGLADEASRLNANTASAEMLASLVGFGVPAAEAFVAARARLAESIGAASGEVAGPSVGLTGAISSQAQLAGLLTSVLAMQPGPSPQAEPLASAPWDNPRDLDRRVALLLRHLTIWTRVWNRTAEGRPRVDINRAGTGELLRRLGDVLDDMQIEGIVNARRERAFESIGELLTRELTARDAQGRPIVVRVSRQQFTPIADLITISDQPILVGRINVNTAPSEVLMCLPGLTADAIGDLIASRGGRQAAQLASIAWLLEFLSDRQFARLASHVTTRSQQFRVNIACGDADGRQATYAQAVVERNHGRSAVLYVERFSGVWADPLEQRARGEPTVALR